jgi:hypothetical protein
VGGLWDECCGVGPEGHGTRQSERIFEVLEARWSVWNSGVESSTPCLSMRKSRGPMDRADRVLACDTSDATLSALWHKVVVRAQFLAAKDCRRFYATLVIACRCSALCSPVPFEVRGKNSIDEVQ